MNQMFAVLKQNELRSSLRMHGGLMSCVGLYIHRHQKPLQVVKEGQETPFKKKTENDHDSSYSHFNIRITV